MSSTPHLNEYFKDFLTEIRLTDDQREALIEAHKELRERLASCEDTKDVIVDTFLQGSYKRSTIIRPASEQASDVDVVCVTSLSEDQYSPEQALDRFIPFLERYYPSGYSKNGRSWCIELKDADMDLVPTSAPSEAVEENVRTLSRIASVSVEEISDRELLSIRHSSSVGAEARSILGEAAQWKEEPLRIPDREAGEWEDTDPLSQITWTIEKNKRCSSHYINVVKAIKWWWRVVHSDKKYPKGYPLEHLIGDCCPDGIESVAEGTVEALEAIAREHRTKPFLSDRGLPDNDVFARVSDEDYRLFYEAAVDAAKIARDAFDADDDYSASLKWRELFGDSFPEAPKSTSKAAFTARAVTATALSEGQFA